MHCSIIRASPNAWRRVKNGSCRSAPVTLRWFDFITPSTLQLAPLLELLLEPVRCARLQAELQLGLQEALVNAVRHGNGCDPGKCVRVRRIESPNWWIWQVQDEGPGVPSSGRCAQLPQQCDATGGRGLFLIHHCFDDVRWSRRGNRLQLAVNRSRQLRRFNGGAAGSLDR